MKPKVFLSHNKNDKEFIVRIANDLRSCGIDVWYDEWEIPPGESLRRKIFEDGITTCDVFFVYLTSNSINSLWVQKELDSAFLHEIELKDSFTLLYVDNSMVREKLSIDLKALNIPEFNYENYVIPFGKLISKAWSVFFKNQQKLMLKGKDFKILELENKVLLLRQNSNIDFEKVKTFLESTIFIWEDRQFYLIDLLKLLRLPLADGCNNKTIISAVNELLGFPKTEVQWALIYYGVWKKYEVFHFTGELILKGLIEIRNTENLEQYYFLTREGIEFLNKF
jgi:hypothetical protein